MDRRAVLNHALAAFGDNQTQLAEALGVKGPTVNRWYSGKSGIDFESCLRLAKVTGLPAATVLRAGGHDPTLLPAGDPELATEGRAKVITLERIVSEMRRLISALDPPVNAPESGAVNVPDAPETRATRRSKGGLTASSHGPLGLGLARTLALTTQVAGL